MRFQDASLQKKLIYLYIELTHSFIHFLFIYLKIYVLKLFLCYLLITFINYVILMLKMLNINLTRYSNNIITLC